MSIKFAVRSEVGNIRRNNEDNFYCNGIFMNADEREKPFFMTGITECPCVFAVCDGMGGMDYGELASLTAVETLAEYAKNFSQSSNEYYEVKNYVKAVNHKLISQKNRQNLMAGTTLALVNIVENSFTTYNLGDSRIYRTQNGRLLRITDDHTVAEDKVRMGIMTPQQAQRSKEWHILTRCLGLSDNEFSTMPDVNGAYPLEGRILICSDGITDMLTYKDISEIVLNTEDFAATANELVESALNKGGYDNTTCIVIEN